MEKEGQGVRLEDLGLLFWLEEIVDASFVCLCGGMC